MSTPARVVVVPGAPGYQDGRLDLDSLVRVLVRVIAMAVLVAGCATSSHHSAAPATPATGPSSTGGPATSASVVTTESSTPASTAPPGSSGPASSSNGGPVATTVPASPRICGAGQLAASLESPNGTAGTIYYSLDLRDVSSTACFVEGYPGVSFVAGRDGHQVGNPAERVAGPTPRIVLGPQRSAEAVLAVVDAANYGTSCQLTPVLGLRVYPPDQTAALYVPSANQACANTQYTTLRIGPLGP